MEKTSSETLKVKIISPQGEIYKGEALSVSSENSVGKFDILPRHANLITLIKDKPIVVRSSSGDFTIEPSLAVIHCKRDRVIIYSDLHLFTPKLEI